MTVMADSTSKKDKIAAAKKKLKQYKKSGGMSTIVDGVITPPATRGQSPQVDATENSHLTDSNSSAAIRSNSEIANSKMPDRPLTSSTERLHQLSRQVTGLINQSSSYLNGQGESNSEYDNLEKRNRDLASLLEQHSQMNSQLTIQLDELKQQNSRLQQALESERKSHEDKMKRELGALKEQLQVHIQTIGILVAEKTELQSSLNQSQKLAEARHSEIEELAGRLKASRQRVNDLERNFNSASSSSQKNEKSNKELSKDMEKLKLDLYKMSKSNEEFEQHNAELQGKLQQKIGEAARAEDELIELKGKLEITELFVQQLQGGKDIPDRNSFQEMDKLVMEKTELQTKLHQQEEAMFRQIAERDALTLQYQQYIEQQQQQMQNLQAQMISLTDEKDKQMRQCDELEATISELRAKHDAADENQSIRSQEKTEMKETIDLLSSHLAAVNKNLEVQIADNSQLSRLVIEKEERIVELELEMEQLGSSTADKDKLLETIQSDKTALSRAVAQNKELKNQLAELQNRFVKMSTENMEMLTQLQSEQHISKELAARLGHQEEELKELREQFMEKEHLLNDLRRRDAERAVANRNELTSEGMEDRIQEFQQQLPLVETLQRELASAQDTINALTNQNSSLRSEMIQMHSKDFSNENSDASNLQVESLSASVRQLEMERNDALHQLKESQLVQKTLEEKLDNIQHDLAVQVPATVNGDIVTKAHFEALQHAMEMLEAKYTPIMREKADLVDKTENLEHIIMQLQGESDTIGEYVTLYQTQRSLLRQRTAEKDSYIYQLAHERIEMQNKLGELQALVMRLLGERRMLHSYQNTNQLLQNSETLSNHTTPHKHIHSHIKRPKRSPVDAADGDQQEDWPDYSSSCSESEVAQANEANDQTLGNISDHHLLDVNLHSPDVSTAVSMPTLTSENKLIPSMTDDMTAQRIMHLLNEIGTSNLVERLAYDEHHFRYCNRCSGRVVML